MCALGIHSLKRPQSARRRNSGQQASDIHERPLLTEQEFQRLVSLERKRSERSGKPVILMLLDGAGLFATNGDGSVRTMVNEALLSSIRDTDVLGWYKADAVLAVLFTEIAGPPVEVANVLLTKITMALRQAISDHDAARIDISLHLFPEPMDHNPSGPDDLVFYPDLQKRKGPDKTTILKRTMDVLLGTLMLLLLLPVLLVIALVIKLSSKGPVFFRQTRVGQYGRSFVFLKFRSMYINDGSLHREYVARFIAGAKDTKQSGRNGKGVYKITRDPRITPFGRFLRKTSLDELPQLINVLKGEMSLVGPRPAVPYEVAQYDTWHRRRLLAVKPGITGLWQVNGRSRTTFDEMVRLDLKYIQQVSLVLDVKILLRTPRVVLSGDGAY